MKFVKGIIIHILFCTPLAKGEVFGNLSFSDMTKTCFERLKPISTSRDFEKKQSERTLLLVKSVMIVPALRYYNKSTEIKRGKDDLDTLRKLFGLTFYTSRGLGVGRKDQKFLHDIYSDISNHKITYMEFSKLIYKGSSTGYFCKSISSERDYTLADNARIISETLDDLKNDLAEATSSEKLTDIMETYDIARSKYISEINKSQVVRRVVYD